MCGIDRKAQKILKHNIIFNLSKIISQQIDKHAFWDFQNLGVPEKRPRFFSNCFDISKQVSQIISFFRFSLAEDYAKITIFAWVSPFKIHTNNHLISPRNFNIVKSGFSALDTLLKKVLLSDVVSISELSWEVLNFFTG